MDHEGVFYASVFMLPVRIVMWTIGYFLLYERQSKSIYLRKVMTHPCIVSIYLGHARNDRGNRIPDLYCKYHRKGQQL